MKKYFVVFILIFIFTMDLFSHEQNVKIVVEDLKNDSMKIYARLGDRGSLIAGVPVKLISIVTQKVLYEDILKKEGLIIKIPTESYLIIVSPRGKRVEKLGIAPLGGFTKKASKPVKIAFYTTLGFSLFFILLAFYLSFQRVKEKG